MSDYKTMACGARTWVGQEDHVRRCKDCQIAAMETRETWLEKRLREKQDDPGFLKAKIEILEGELKPMEELIESLQRQLHEAREEIERKDAENQQLRHDLDHAEGLNYSSDHVETCTECAAWRPKAAEEADRD